MDSTRKNRDFRIIVPLELLAQASNTRQLFYVIRGLIAAISLLDGGIGTMRNTTRAKNTRGLRESI